MKIFEKKIKIAKVILKSQRKNSGRINIRRENWSGHKCSACPVRNWRNFHPYPICWHRYRSKTVKQWKPKLWESMSRQLNFQTSLTLIFIFSLDSTSVWDWLWSFKRGCRLFTTTWLGESGWVWAQTLFIIDKNSYKSLIITLYDIINSQFKWAKIRIIFTMWTATLLALDIKLRTKNPSFFRRHLFP